MRASFLNSLVWLVHILDCDDSQIAVISEVAKGDASTGLDTQFANGLFRHVKADGHAEEVSIRKAQVLDHTGQGVSQVPSVQWDADHTHCSPFRSRSLSVSVLALGFTGLLLPLLRTQHANRSRLSGPPVCAGCTCAVEDPSSAHSSPHQPHGVLFGGGKFQARKTRTFQR